MDARRSSCKKCIRDMEWKGRTSWSDKSSEPDGEAAILWAAIRRAYPRQGVADGCQCDSSLRISTRKTPDADAEGVRGWSIGFGNQVRPFPVRFPAAELCRTLRHASVSSNHRHHCPIRPHSATLQRTTRPRRLAF